MLEQLIENAVELLGLMQEGETVDELEEANKLVAGISRDVAFVDGCVTAALQAQRDAEDEEETCDDCGGSFAPCLIIDGYCEECAAKNE